MDFCHSPTRIFAQPYRLPWSDGTRFTTWGKPPTVSVFQYIGDVMLTSNLLADLNAAVRILRQALDSGVAVNDYKVQGSVTFSGAVWPSQTEAMPEAVMDKVQAYP